MSIVSYVKHAHYICDKCINVAKQCIIVDALYT